MTTIMKHKLLYIAAAVLCLAACTKKQTSDLQLKGDCLVESVALDGYEGNINLAERSIVVRLPEVYETSAMEITALKVSEGAACNVQIGQKLNMDAAKVLHVTNGDAAIDWTISVLHDEARITHFVVADIYQGIINQEAFTIDVFVPGSVDVTSLAPVVTVSKNATVTPASGAAQDFTNPVVYTVDNNSAHSEYTVTVTVLNKPKALFLGIPGTMDGLDPEAKEACMWMLANVPGAQYASFEQIKSGSINLDECKVMWWHFHMDGGVDGHDAFMAKAPEAIDAKNQIREFYEAGGALLLTRYATNLASFIGATGDDEWTTPNNCWGQNEDSAELCGGPWDFRIYDGQSGHALYAGIIMGDDPAKVLCTDAGYHITNSTAQYHIGTDWGDYADHAAWTGRTGGTILGVGGDGAVVAWEYPAKDGKGGIIGIGSGCYDWYSYTFEAGYEENYHKNIAIMTTNAINYLTK